jgi:PTS hybrid protein
VIALVLVSHSLKLAEGTAEMARQMAPEVTIIPTGGDASGGLGTSLPAVVDAAERALASADGVVLIPDIGSSVLTSQAALGMLAVGQERALVIDAPLVEGAVAAAVAAQQGRSLEEVCQAARSSMGARREENDLGLTEDGQTRITRRITLTDPLGLHARPAALVARRAAELGVPMTIDGVDASSVLALMALGAVGGQEIEIAAHGPSASGAVADIIDLICTGLD